jgi:hypothetical protein
LDAEWKKSAECVDADKNGLVQSPRDLAKPAIGAAVEVRRELQA